MKEELLNLLRESKEFGEEDAWSICFVILGDLLNNSKGSERHVVGWCRVLEEMMDKRERV